MKKERSKKELQNDLLFYPEYYREITSRSRRIIWGREIKELISELKKLGTDE